jgi:hypothetical protein
MKVDTILDYRQELMEETKKIQITKEVVHILWKQLSVI